MRRKAQKKRRKTQGNAMPVVADAKNYKVGYGKPPKRTQFKKGTSGNKKGRPKGIKNFATLFHDEMNRRITVVENGQRRTITIGEAILKQLTNKGATGDQKAIQGVINLLKQLGALTLPDPAQQQQRKRFGLRIFGTDPATGERVRVKPGTTERIDGDDDGE